MPQRRRIHWPKVTRDGFLFALGCFLLVRESWRPEAAHSELVYAALALLLSPAALRLDEFRRDRGKQ